PLTLVCFSVLPVLIVCAILFSVTSQNAFREVRVKIASLNSKIQENITGISVVKAFCREKATVLKFQKLNQENYAANMKQTIVFALFTPFVDLTRVSAIALIIWYGGGKTITEALTLGTLVVFLYYMRMFFTPIQDIAEKYNIIQSAFASLERIYLLLHDTSIIADPPAPVRPEIFPGTIEFRNVSFSYNENEPVLSDVSFSVKSGETVAIVGLTGAGKSTIINLIERFYDVTRGSICIGGTDIRRMDSSFLRSNIGLVMQDVFLFSGTIESNITLGSTLYSPEQINHAAAVANAAGFIQRLPAGMQEEVQEGGKTLSAGQRQLLSFARAVLINPRILILDEATSNIDPVTEGLIQDAMEKLLQGRTAIIIAHRFSTIRRADRIIVLHKGRIHEQGTHDELLAQEGLYRQLYDLQYKLNP
ncbi:MAG: ABC transporter ATP-binding protein, partial [Pseudomonadota bacterium]